MASYNQHHRSSWSSAQFRMTSTIEFPATTSKSSMSLVSGRHATALEVCDVLYGPSPSPPDLEAIERYYEAGATYENPFVTATSRSLIADIHAFARALATVDVPTPRAALAVLFPFLGGEDGRWFRGMRVWSEIGNICESESFDGHRRAVVSHTLHILLLPGLHSPAFSSPYTPLPSHAQTPSAASALSPPHHSPSASLISLPPSLPYNHTPTQKILGIPSPLHRTLPLHTHLAFNEANRITAHRDVLDVRDALNLIPGGQGVGWIVGRVVGQGLGLLGRVASRVSLRGDAETAREGERRRWGAAGSVGEEGKGRWDAEEGPTVDVESATP